MLFVQASGTVRSFPDAALARRTLTEDAFMFCP
jgi:hypothetical protein